MTLRRRENLDLFDGELLRRRLQSFLTRMDHALVGAAEALPNYELRKIEVALAIDTGLNISFAGAGGNVDRSRTLTFTLHPKVKA